MVEKNKIPSTTESREDTQKEIKNLLKLLLGVVFVALAIISVTGMLAFRNAEDGKAISAQNNRFLDNFANYMRCLIVNEDEVVIAVGEDAYVALCEELLYKDTGKKPSPTVVTIPPNATTTTIAAPEGG